MKTMRTLIVIALCLLSISVFAQDPPVRSQNYNVRINNSNPFILLDTDSVAKQSQVTAHEDSIADHRTEINAHTDSIADHRTEINAHEDSITNHRTDITSHADSITAINSELDDVVDASTITSGLDALYVQDSMKNKNGKIAHYIGATQYYPAIEEQTNAIRAVQDAGGTLQAVCTWCDLIPLNSLAIVDQRIVFSNIYIPEGATDLTGIYWAQTVTGDYTASNNNKVGLYSVDGDSIRLVASSANDGNLWKAADSTFQYKAFSAAYSNPEPGVYYTAFLYCRSAVSTAPQIGSRYNAITGLNARALIGNNHVSSGYIDTQTDLPAAIALADINQLTSIYWSGVY